MKNDSMGKTVQLYRRVICWLDENMGKLAVAVIIVATVEVFVFAPVEMREKLTSSLIGLFSMLIAGLFFYFAFRLASFVFSSMQAVKVVNWEIDWSVMIKILSVFLLIGIIFYFFYYPWAAQEMAAEELLPVNLLPALIGVYWAIRKSEKREKAQI